VLEVKEAELKEQWIQGLFTDQSQYATAIKNAEAIGKSQGYRFIMEFDWEDMLEEESDGSD
jgi:hypothetical protein